MAESISYEWLALQSSLLFAVHTLVSNLGYACSCPNPDSVEENNIEHLRVDSVIYVHECCCNVRVVGQS
jgi:hypothetical protein